VSETLFRKVGVGVYLVDPIYNKADDLAANMIITDEERGGTYAVTMLAQKGQRVH
jgi:hypothetical protein